MTSLSRLLAAAAVASIAFSGAAIAQSNTGATNAKDAMMEKDAMKKDAMMKKDDMKKDAMAPHGDMKKDDMKKDSMMKKDEMKK
jgi:pentapeptide MXKDX repeat protein